MIRSRALQILRPCAFSRVVSQESFESFALRYRPSPSHRASLAELGALHGEDAHPIKEPSSGKGASLRLRALSSPEGTAPEARELVSWRLVDLASVEAEARNAITRRR